MKKNLLITSLLFLFSFLATPTTVKAQIKDTITFDYDAYTGCDACGDKMTYLTQTYDSITDVPKAGYYINSIKIKLKLFACYTGDVYLYLNGSKIGTATSNYNCACNACDSITFVISANDVNTYYKKSQKNYLEVIASASNTLYLDRVVMMRFYEKKINFDAGIVSVDSPSVFVCAGSKTIKVKINNNGKKSFSGVALDWKWNGISQTGTSYTGTLDTLNGSGNNTALASLGTKTFTNGKKDTLMVWTKNPGGIADSSNFNDTMRWVFNGSYGDTIRVGGSSPHFTTIQGAVNAIMNSGICAPVYIKIWPGTYNEQVSIGSIPGSGTTNTVTFLSKTNDSSSVIINYSANSSNNFTIGMTNCSNIKFHKITIEALHSTYGKAIYMNGYQENISFVNCYIKGVSTTSTGDNMAVVSRNYSTSGDKTNNISFTQTHIENGSYGIHFNNAYDNPGKGFYVKNCLIENQYYMNIFYQYGKNIGLNNNIINRNSSSLYYGYGVYMNYTTDSLTIVNNNISQNNGSQGGIFLYNCSGTSTKRNLIANNFISASSSSTSYYALYSYYGGYSDFVNNNIYHSTSYNYTYAMYVYEGGNNRFLYNNVYNANQGVAFYIYNGISKSDRNNFYNSGNTLGTWNSSGINSIDDLKILGTDSNSVSVNPNYTSATNLHVYHPDLDGRARPHSGVGRDIDGQLRNATTPDIGADEFKLAALDAGISEAKRPLSGAQCLKVVFKNYGNSTLTSAKIDWVLNGTAKTQVNWTGSVAKGDTAIVCLGNITFIKDSLYKLKAWSSAPNGGSDSLKSNDTLTTQFYPAMRGVYTIGGTTPDFATFSDAVAAVKKAGVLDSVWFRVRNGTYTEQIELTQISGTNLKNSIIFESEAKDSSKVILQYGSSNYSNNYVVQLNNARGITFRKMTLQNTSTYYRTVVKFLNASRIIRFENNILQNSDSTSSDYYTSLVVSENNKGSEIYFLRNIFNKGAYGLYIYGDYSFYENKVVIQNNIFKSQSYIPAYLYYTSSVEFSDNTITASTNNLNAGVYFGSFKGAPKIYNNNITVSGNNCYYGVYLYNFYGGDTIKFYNNLISISSNTNGHGLYAYDLENAHIYYNNILNQCSDSSSESAAIYFNYGNYKIKNNNFIHLKNGYSIYKDYTNNVESNFNNIYSNGTKYVAWNSNKYDDLADYSSTEIQDTNSLEVDPIYNSPSDLHVSFSGINGKGKPISGITKDIDGETRNTSTPDIGADEFTPLALDAGVSKFLNPGEIFRPGNTNVTVVVTNFGLDSIKNVTVKVKINNDTLARKYVTRTIPSGDTIHVKIGNYNFKADSIYNIVGWTFLPNSSTDQKKSNDTLKILGRRPAMTGVYTIGGTSPDFPSFKAAINAMKVAGIADSVRFRVRAGTYTEQLSIPPISGAGARNSIIFESEDFDSTSVILQYSQTYYDTNYVVQLAGADGITFRYMTIKSISTGSYTVVFDIRNGAINNSIYKNIIQNPVTTSSSTYNSLIYSGNSADDNFHIKNNILKNGSMSIYLNGYPLGSPYYYEKGLEIKDNRMQNPYYYGIFLEELDSVNVSGNYLEMYRYMYSYGFYFNYLRTNISITNNKIYMPLGYMGVNMYNSGSYFKQSLVSNNSIYVKNTSTNPYGLYLYYSYYIDYIHNSINVESPFSTSYTAIMYYGSNNNLYNNIFSNNSSYAIYIPSTSTLSNSNYNDFVTKGSPLGYYNGSIINNLASWQSATGKDANSISIDPIFKSASNLHAKEVSLNGAAQYFKTVPLDFDGEERDTLTPDIGADEFQLPPNDAGISKILVPNKPFPSDSQQVKVVIKNFGGNPLYVADINWKFNGVSQTTKSWADTLYAGDTMHVNLGKKFFNRDSAYSMIAWTTNPNGTGDSIPSNDTAKVMNQYPALSGVYTIGGASPNFATFTDAVNAMKRGGIINWVRFDVRAGSYYEQIKIPYIAGADSEDDIIFQSEVQDSSKVFLISTNTSSDNYTVRLDSTNGITFRHMSFRTTGTYYYNLIFEILQGAKNINIHDCNISGSTNNTASSSEALIYYTNSNSSLPSFDNIEIYNNRLTHGEYGVYAYGYSYSGSGYAKDLNIHHNNMEDQYYRGIEIGYINNFKIDNNSIYHTTTSGYYYSMGIYAYYCNDGFEITNNNIYNQEYYGVYLNQCYGKTGDTSLMANNFIHTRTDNGVFGVYISSPDYLNFFNNNINLTSSSSSSYAGYFHNPSRTTCYNNNFVTSGAGYTIYLNGSFTNSDYNNFYTTGSNLGYHNSNNRTNLAAWKSSTSKDGKSISTNPDYVSATDLHVRGTDLNAAGRNHKYIIIKDIDGESRDSIAPDIGADEFKIPAANDAGILVYLEPIAPFASGSRSVKATIKNYGSDSLKSAIIKWKVNGSLQSSYNWTGALKTGQTQTVTIGTFNFPSGVKHDIVLWTTSPNGANDSTNYNDTAIKKNIYAALAGVYTVGGSAPNFIDLAEAFAALKLGGVVDSVKLKMRSGTHAQDVTVESYPGSSPTRRVYIESETGDSSDVVLTNSNSSGQIVYINGADYLTFRKLTFKPIANYGYTAVRYENSSNQLSFNNCHFNLSNASYYYYYYTSIAIYSSTNKDDSLTVKNCRFEKGTYGIYTYSNSANEKGINISNNVFNDPVNAGVYLQNPDAPKIKYNTLYKSLNSGNTIQIYNSSNELVISHNNIHCSHSAANGILLYNHSSNSSTKANIFNNFIAIKGTDNYQRGIEIDYSAYVNLFHNTFNVYGSNTSSYNLYLYSGNNFDIRNNIFANLGGGYALGFSSSPSISQSDYNDIYSSGTNQGNYNGSNQTTLAAWKTATGKDANSFSLNPQFNSDYDLHTNLSSLDSACNPISGITDDIDLEARNSSKPDIGADEFQSLPENLGVTAFITPTNSCGLDSSYIKIRIFNFGNKPKIGFPVRYRIDGGSITTATVNDSIKPGKELIYQFPNKVGFSANTSYILQSWTDLTGEKFRPNDSTKVTFINYQKPDSVKNMVPSDGTTGIDYPFTLSWAPSTGATKYDVYVWLHGTSRPGTPTLSNTSQISYQITYGLNYGDKYNWQVEAKNPVCNTWGKVQTFTMKHLPDLIVEQVSAPHSAFSANTISVSWKIKNTGQGASNGTWYDAIYLSNDAVLDVTDLYLGAFVNPSALNASQNYTQSGSVTLPNGISGNYYIFIRTDQYNYINEVSKSNNFARDTVKMVVTLTPPPDLIVTSVSRPSTAFSGATANLTYIVKNNGTGPTRSGSWYDKIYLSTEKVVNGTSYELGTRNHTGNLSVDSTYSVSTSVTIPSFISGKYFFVIYTDGGNYEYEHASESNNTKGSDTIKIILTPPPDLITRNLTTIDTANNSESILVKYNVINDGGTTTGGAFYDAVFLGTSSTFSTGTAILLNNVYHNTLNSKDTSKISQNFTIPQTINGTYYLFVFADYYNYINEVSNETNNGTSGHKIIIRSPDLRVSRVVVKSSDTTGDITPVNWTVKNIGPGNDYQGTRTDSIYISKFATWSRTNSTAIGSLRYTTTLLKNDTLQKSTSVQIPNGFDGNRFFFVVADAAKEVYEQGKDTNNYKRSDVMSVVLAPYPDLLPKFLSFPDSAKAGAIIGLGYQVKNNSKNGNPVSSSHWTSAKAKPNWKDRLYFSKDSVYNPTKVFQLVENSRTSTLDTQESYEKTVYMSLPASMARGNYYYYIFTDADNDVYEYTKDTNNIKRTKKVFIDGYPPVDLKVNCPSLIDTMWSGNNYTLSYTVTNIGQAKTAVGAWNDAAYLSSDSILNAGDVLLATININKALEKDSTYKINQSVNIPNGLFGNFYVIIKTDIGKLIIDIDTNNNKKPVCKTSGGAKKIRINLTPPPDLRITSWNIPSTGTSGQPVKIKWKVENNGSGATRSASWMDQLYISTDYTIDASDYFLGEKRHNGNLSVNGFYNDSNEFNIPIDKVGNYIVIIKTDGANAEYENNENNNIVSSVANFTKAPPADLIVSQVTAPDSVLSGKTINVAWKVKNKGSNPASGYLTDNVYLSTDNKQDANDLLLHSEHLYVNIAPNTELSHSKTVSVNGISVGNYYVLVTTDVLNNINESNDTNNTSVAGNLLNVNVPLLPIAVKTKDTLSNGEKIYYRIEIPSTLAGESMLITLKADSTNGDNQIFVRHGAMVSGSEFDYKFREPFKGNQEIIIPDLKVGTYYLLTTGQKTGVSIYQPIILFARIMPFEIRKVTPAIGGNTGEVTVLIEGSKLDDPLIEFGLIRSGSGFTGREDTSGLRYQYSVATSNSLEILDPTTVYATFNLIGKDTGKYDVVATKLSENAVLQKGFQVVPGNLGDLDITVNRPGNQRANSVLSMTVIFTNKGNTDLINHKIMITSSAGAPIGFSEADLSKSYSDLEIIVQENNGPPNRLRPGASGSVTVYTKSSGALGFTILN